MAATRRDGSGEKVTVKRRGSADWDAVYRWWLDANLSRKPGQRKTTLKDTAKHFDTSYETLKEQAQRGEWQMELERERRRIHVRATAEIRDRHFETDVQARLNMVEQAELATTVAERGLHRVLHRMEQDPNFTPEIRTLDRLLRSGQDLKRKALGMADVVELRDEAGEGSASQRLARLQERLDNSAKLQEALDKARQEATKESKAKA